MSANLTLNMEARLDEIERIHAAVEILAQAEGWPEDLLFQIKLVVEEMGTNIVKYGDDGGGQTEVSITLTSESDALIMEIVDSGKPFDPFTEAPPPDLDSPVPDRPIGGLGVYLVQQLMDEARYAREDGKNKLTFIKRRKSRRARFSARPAPRPPGRGGRRHRPDPAGWTRYSRRWTHWRRSGVASLRRGRSLALHPGGSVAALACARATRARGRRR